MNTRHTYYQTQHQLREMAETYFSYVLHDSALSLDERRKILLKDTDSFFTLAKIYRDSELQKYLEKLVLQHIPSIIPKKTTVPNKAPYASRHQKRHSIKRLEEDRTTFTLPANTHSLDQMMQEFSLDSALILQTAQRLDIPVLKHRVGSTIVPIITQSGYEKLKEYVQTLQS